MISEHMPKRGVGDDKLPRKRDRCHIPASTDDSRPGDIIQADLADFWGTTPHSDIIRYLTPFSIGVGLVDDQFGVIVEKGCTYPCENRDLFTSAHNLQTSITLPIYQGENLVANENVLLGVLRIDHLVPELRGNSKNRSNHCTESALHSSGMGKRLKDGAEGYHYNPINGSPPLPQ